MIEVEVKARCSHDVLPKILAMGAVFKETEHHHDIYFNSSARDFRKTDEALRIRIKERGSRLTYKGPKLDSQTKSRREYTVEIDDPQAMEKILAKLGFFPSAEVKKLRTKYILGQVTFALDKVEGLGSFLEIEVRADDNWADKQRKVLDILQQLDPGETIRKSYLELLEDQRSEDNPIS